MKQCPRCNQTYTDANLNFCLNDGELLAQMYASPPPGSYIEDPPPTVMMNDARATNPSNWPQPQQSAPIGQWQPQQILQNQPYANPGFRVSRDQTLPTISLVLGILSLLLVCCYGGIWLGVPAAIIGFLGMRNADSNPQRYGGRGLAIAGMVLGTVSFLSVIVIIFIQVIAS